jgi:Holliday junction resolvase-like predicted endonuclease
MNMREPEVEERVRHYLENSGYMTSPRSEKTGPDIIATKNGRKLLVEVKGDRPGHQSSPGTKNVDVMTLLGQIIHRKGQRLADDYAIAIRPVHLRLVKEAAPALKEMAIKVFLVNDADIQLLE